MRAQSFEHPTALEHHRYKKDHDVDPRVLATLIAWRILTDSCLLRIAVRQVDSQPAEGGGSQWDVAGGGRRQP